MICSSNRQRVGKVSSMIRDFTVEEVRSMPFPDVFEAKLRECAIQHDDKIIRVDVLSCYERLKREYRNAEISRAEQERVNEYRKRLTKISVNGIMLKQRHPAGLQGTTVQTIAQDNTPANNENTKLAEAAARNLS